MVNVLSKYAMSQNKLYLYASSERSILDRKILMLNDYILVGTY